MTDESRRRTVETLDPARNLRITLKEQVRAAAGPPAYAMRRRRIEDLEALILASLAELFARTGDVERARAQALGLRRIVRNVEELARLVDAHNRYFPTEANLPIDMKTGALTERGVPWTPLPSPSLDALLARACRREG